MKQTLLELTQNILSAMEDDEVNSIGDTVSSLSVAQVVQDCYYEMVAEMEIPGNTQLMTLEPLGDVTKPTYMRLPDNYKAITWLRYNDYEVKYITPQEFIKRSISLSDGIACEDFNGVIFQISNTADPTFWTSFDDEYIVFNSYDVTNESSLTRNRSMAFVAYEPTLSLTDDAIPELSSGLFPTLLSKAKARCFINFKQIANNAEEKAERQGKIRNQNIRQRTNRTLNYPNYGKPRR